MAATALHNGLRCFSAMQTDQIVSQWYELFLDLWNQRYRLEQQPRAWLSELWKHFGGDPISADTPSVVVTAILLRVRADFVALEASTRARGTPDDESLSRLHQEARSLHDRWAAVFRAERAEWPSDPAPPAES